LSNGVGQLSFVVPSDAPLGAQSLTVTCSSGATNNTFNVLVTDTPAPVVTDLLHSSIASGDTLVIEGSNLDQVSRVVAVSLDHSKTAGCFIDSNASTADSISCAFDSIDLGDYSVVVESNCGYAANSPVLSIVPPV
jgi:hypothetical protein